MMTQLFHADCFDVFPNIDAHSIDLVILDLPYNQTACKFDKNKVDLDKLWKELKRIGKPKAAYIFFCTTRFGHELISSNKPYFRRDLCYVKSMSTLFYHANYQELRAHEMIYIFSKGRTTYNPQKTDGQPYTRVPGRRTELYAGQSPRVNTQNADGKRFPRSVIHIDKSNYKSTHPTAKPYEIMQYIIRTYSNENDTVLDPFMGTGSSAQVCLDNNRRYIGIEKDIKYYQIAKEITES